MYNTGDFRSVGDRNGQLDHLGRADDQIKFKGFRVELDGVANAMRVRWRFPLISSVAIIDTQEYIELRPGPKCRRAARRHRALGFRNAFHG